MASKAVAESTKLQLQSAVAELRRILNEEVALVLEEIAELGASPDAVKELRYLLGEDAKIALDEIEELGGPGHYKKWVMFNIEELNMIANNANFRK